MTWFMMIHHEAFWIFYKQIVIKKSSRLIFHKKSLVAGLTPCVAILFAYM